MTTEYLPIKSEDLDSFTIHMNALALDGWKLHMGSYQFITAGSNLWYSCIMYRDDPKPVGRQRRSPRPPIKPQRR